MYWDALAVDQKERVLGVADFDWSYVLLMVSISVYSFHKAQHKELGHGIDDAVMGNKITICTFEV